MEIPVVIPEDNKVVPEYLEETALADLVTEGQETDALVTAVRVMADQDMAGQDTEDQDIMDTEAG